MRKSLVKRFCLYAPVLILSLTIISCSSTKKIKYFQDIPDSGQLKTIAKVDYSPPKIQTDDILTVILQLADPSASQIVNVGNVPITATGIAAAAAGSGAAQVVAGFLVNKDGEIDMPVLGKIKVGGHTTFEAADLIRAKAATLYNDPTVIVRYANFKITVTGEVTRPGIYIVPNEKVNILDALSLAGDLTIYGKRDNVLLIRENPDGTKTPYRINLTNSDMMSSNSAYYLRQNDIVYVEPGKAKSVITDATLTRTYAILGTVLTLLVVIASRIKY